MVQQPLKVLTTGANGLIGNLVHARLAAQPKRYDSYGTARRKQPSDRIQAGFFPIHDDKLRIADMTDFAAVQRAVDGMDVVVHMAADPSGQNGYESVLHNNIVGAHNLFEACRLAGVRRVIYASTNQVVFGYTHDEPYKSLWQGRYDGIDMHAYRPVHHTWPTRPLNDYACSKVYGEGLAHMYSAEHSLSCIVLRIGWVTGDDQLPQYPGLNAGMLWCSQRDIVQLVQRCIDAPDHLRFDVFFGQSNNRYNLVDISHAQQMLGYAPEDSAETKLAAK